jgi:hypothetical protein
MFVHIDPKTTTKIVRFLNIRGHRRIWSKYRFVVVFIRHVTENRRNGKLTHSLTLDWNMYPVLPGRNAHVEGTENCNKHVPRTDL